MKKRNSLIELFRFIFAINVVQSHGLFIYSGQYFGHGRLSVEFFFILTGLLLVRSISKYIEQPFFKGFFSFFLTKLKGIFLPVLIAIPFNIAYCIVKDQSINIFGYLWYVKQMLNYFAIFFIIRYFVKKEKIFILIISLIFAFTTIMNCFSVFYETGIVRAFMGISLGVLISYIPKIKIKNQNLLWIINIPLMILTFLGLFFGANLFQEKILQLIIYPALIYFTFQINIHNKFFNYLGALSFGLYAFQCVVRVFKETGYNNTWVLFGVILILSIAEDGVRRIINYYQNKNKKIKTVSK